MQNGGNIIPIQIDGTLDDCTRLVSEIILDRSFTARYRVTSPNAMNIGRLLPQAFYFLYAFILLKNRLHGKLLFSVPSGNLGNLIAGLYAWKFGLPVSGFIAAQNCNNPLGSLINGNTEHSHPVPTLTPAIDVSCPVTYERLNAFYREAPLVMKNMVYPLVSSDDEVRAAMKKAHHDYGVSLDPHGALALAAAEKQTAYSRQEAHTIVLATGHPAKYASLFTEVTGALPPTDPKFAQLQIESQPIATIPPQLDLFESAIASCV
jgi:threonine synthase